MEQLRIHCCTVPCTHVLHMHLNKLRMLREFNLKMHASHLREKNLVRSHASALDVNSYLHTKLGGGGVIQFRFGCHTAKTEHAE